MTANQHEQLNLVQKIAQVQAGLPPEIKKEGYNAKQGFHYVTEAQVKKLVRNPLAVLGVIIVPKYEVTNEWTETTKKGGQMHYASVQGTFELRDGNESIIGSMLGTGMDMSDKAIYKAETGAQKNYLMQLFMISTGDDPERDDTPNGQSKNQYSNNNNYRNTGYRSSNQRQPSNRNQYNGNNQRKQAETQINNKMFDQVRDKIREAAGIYRLTSDDISVTLKNKFHYTDLNQITNVLAAQILTYLSKAIRDERKKQSVSASNNS
ncbi:ERF family protein [Companilactobacillus nantensis]|uniref:Single-stranded DNA-binding protein n=1 Tax=Companilactobacillus nantensis DSM 16982 TaxID=1423774 RepID=A0A0R1WKD3_9LACO|nr:ERF family protein [Companilactobacillus nantensis]KRM18442.1 hypothetical protein FD31_GL000989 [Companilactobacillus nantensis DSM 16982]GEO63012.1 hypothetical protein LNA01_01950 [Companilactobacillus nantensis]